ncbi:uncharacterized protein EV420DRAFT_340886 [Desarmillaria tabescens]|uniref:Uncharacterized protein n=1 Tax=Armillaria tabescens TaxID=1929756 RepID=A0AA39N5J5_ARMTA|nr:uncharacterized protein EV420DRAFT_340886 [Desarmillaria tabescens]KAK0458941.1 hypothetical protein EV420DRAFT_340886 [Desarmillaria tabescens]
MPEGITEKRFTGVVNLTLAHLCPLGIALNGARQMIRAGTILKCGHQSTLFCSKIIMSEQVLLVSKVQDQHLQASETCHMSLNTESFFLFPCSFCLFFIVHVLLCPSIHLS